MLIVDFANIYMTVNIYKLHNNCESGRYTIGLLIFTPAGLEINFFVREPAGD